MITIHARGNEKIGIGNLARCYELVKFLSTKGYEVVGIFECDEKLFARFENEKIFRSSEFSNSLNLIKKLKTQIYICDLLDADANLSDTLRDIGVKKIVHFNGLEKGFRPDVLVVMDDFEYELKFKDLKIYRGFKYYIIANDIVKNRPANAKQIKNIKNVLISFGGSDPAYFSEYFAKTISDDKYRYTLILGPAMSLERKEFIKSIKKPNLAYIDSPSNLINLLLECDLFVTLGGMSTYEAMCLGIPASGVRWSYLGYCVEQFGKKAMINDLGNIDKAYENLLNLNIENVNKICQNAFDIIDGKSLQNIEKIIRNLI
ncbi:MAG: hypothetical protein K5978_06515 [Campylobacter sp.]|nr:hypothetical protein [Campylobacter sp.]